MWTSSQSTRGSRGAAKLKTMIKIILKMEELKTIKLAKKKRVKHLCAYPAPAILRRWKGLLMSSRTGLIGSAVSTVFADALWVRTPRGFRRRTGKS